jgi:predicted Zn-dependent protease
LVDLRVDDNKAPLVEMERLLKTHRAYEHMNNGDLATETNNMKLAMQEYEAAMKMFPNNLEMQYWTAITLANNGEIQKASLILKAIYTKEPNWKLMTQRLPKSGLLTVKGNDLTLLL